VSTHTHTNLSLCGAPDATFDGVLRVAAQRRYELVALTDHVHVPYVTDYAGHLGRLARYREWRAAASPPFALVIGGEFEVLAPGRVLAPPELVAACECVIAAPNHYQLPWIEDPPADVAGAAAHELACIETILAWPAAQVVAHPFFGGGKGHSTDALLAACDRQRLDEVIHRAVERGVAFEIQPKFWLDPAAGRLGEFFAVVLARGGRLALGSDAHNLAGLEAWAAAVPAIVARFGLRREDLWLPAAAGASG